MKVNINLLNGIRYPSLAAVPFQLGAVSVTSLNSSWTLFEDNVIIPCHVEVINKWAEDESVKWVHIYAVFEGGKSYEFKEGLPLSNNSGTFTWNPYPWEVKVIEEIDGLGRVHWSETLSNANNYTLIPSIGIENFDKFGSIIAKPNNEENTIVKEIDNAFLKIFRYEGWLIPEIGYEPQNMKQYKYILRQIKYANHDLIKYSLSVVFATEMTNKKICSIGVDIDLNDNGATSSYSYLKNNVLESIETNVLTVSQRKFNQIQVNNAAANDWLTDSKCNGYFSNGSQTILIRDFWQKYPQAVNLRFNNGKFIKYHQWYSDTVSAFSLNEITNTNNLHKLLHWHNGPTFRNNSYDEWALAFYAQQPEFSSLKEGEKYAYSGNTVVPSEIHIDFQGKSIHDDFAIIPLSAIGSNQIEWNTIWQSNPVGYCNGSYIETTNIFDFAAKGLDYQNVENFIEESTLGYTDPSRYETYGRFMFGESHRTHNIAEERPELYRLGLAQYYNAGENNWRMWLRGGNENKNIETENTRSILQHARRSTEHYRNTIFNSYNELRRNLNRTEPKIQFHNVGSTWARGLWWGADYNQSQGDADWSMLVGRDTDPDNLLLSWIIDGNRHHKDAYELWFSKAYNQIGKDSFSNSQFGRDINKQLVYGINAYEYFFWNAGFRSIFLNPNLHMYNGQGKTYLDAIRSLGIGSQSIKLNEYTNFGKGGPLFHPEWIKKFMKYDNRSLVNGLPPSINYLIGNNDFDNYKAFYNEGYFALDVTNILIDYLIANPIDTILKNKIVEVMTQLNDRIAALIQKIYKGNNIKWKDFGIGDGSLGDSGFKIQWGAYLKRLRQNINGLPININSPIMGGHYPNNQSSIFNLYSPYRSWGNDIYLYKEDDESLKINFKVSPFSHDVGGSFPGSEIWISCPSTITENKTNNPATWSTIYETGTWVNVFNLASYIQNPSSYNSNNLNNYLGTRFLGYDIFDVDANQRTTINGLNYHQWTREYLNLSSETLNQKFRERGLYKISCVGQSLFQQLGETENGARKYKEAMLLRTPVDTNTPQNYILSDTFFYYKNIESFVTTLVFWSSKLTLSNKGTFFRVQVFESLNFNPQTSQPISDESLIFLSNGSNNPPNRFEVVFQPGEIKPIKTIAVYRGIGRVSTNGRVLVSASKEDIETVSGALCLTANYVTGNISTNQDAKANIITVNENAIHPSTSVRYKAGNSVLLNPGFKAESGAIFKAEIGGCN